MENKKISFGFSRVTKKTEIVSKVPKPQKKVELIDCLEGQSIKIKDKIEEVKGPLIIPISDNTSNLIDKVKEAVEKRLKTETDTASIKQEIEEPPDSELTLDELAARELIREAQNRGTTSTVPKIHTLPIQEEKFVAEGEPESTLEDYENVPISEYGFAMLRGMGWKEGMAIGKRPSQTAAPSVPELRPKGLGLGANKMVNANKPKQSLDKNGKELTLVKGSFGKIIAGTHRGQYCLVQGFDDENCRIIVKTTITNNILTLNEFLLVPVTKEEFTLGSKVLNNAKYEEYKEMSDKKLRDRSGSRNRDVKPERHHSPQPKNGKYRKAAHHSAEKRRDRSRSTERRRGRSRSRSNDRNAKKYYSSDEQEDEQKHSKCHSDSDSSSQRKRKEKKHRKHSKSKKHKKKSSSKSKYRNSDSDSDHRRYGKDKR